MTRAYIRLDPAFDERKEPYPDGAYRALIATLCMAETQPVRGRFRSLDYLRRLLGRCGKWAGYLLEHGDIVELTDGRVYVDGWDEWQEGDVTVAERQRRIRSRRGMRNAARNGERNGSVTAPVTADRLVLDSLTISSGAVHSKAARRDAAHAMEPPSDDERIAFLLSRWTATVDTPSTRTRIAEELFGLGIPDPDAELARRAAA